MSPKAVLYALIPLIATACAPALKDGPQKVEQVKLPPSLVHSNPAIQPVQNYALGRWWLIFNDPALNALLELGIKENPSLSEAKSRIEIAQAQVSIAGSREYPHLDSTNAITRLHQSSNGDHAIYNGKSYTVANIDPLVVSYHVDIFGEDQELVSRAQANAEMARAQYRQGVLMLRAAIVKTYYALKISRRLINEQNEIIRLSEAALTVKQAAYRAGLQSSTDALAQKTYISTTRIRLADLKQKQQALNFALAALLGKTPDYLPQVVSDESEIPDKLPIPEVIGLETLAQRPDIELALWNIESALHTEKLARKAYYPNVDLRALIGLNSIGLGSLFRAGSLTYAAAPALSLPIFEGGALKGRFDASAAAYDEAVFFYNHTLLDAAQQVATQLANLDNTKAALAEKSETLDQLHALAKVRSAEFRSGVSDKLVAIEVQMQWMNAHLTYQEGKLNWIYAITDAATALGGEFQGGQDGR